MRRDLGKNSKKNCNNANDDQNDQKKTDAKGELNLIYAKL